MKKRPLLQRRNNRSSSPETLATMHERIREALNSGDVMKAVDQSRHLLEKLPHDGETLHLLGVALLKAGKHEEAIQRIEQATTINSQIPQYHCNLGEALRVAGLYDRGASSCRRAVELWPEYTQARINLGCCLFALKAFEDALAQFDTALGKTQSNADLHAFRGDALRELGHIASALNAYQQALSLNPGHVHAHTNLGPLLMMLGQAPEALDHCRRAVDLAPGHGLVHLNLGKCLALVEDIEAAMESYATAYDLMPHSAQLCCNIGDVWQEIGDLVQATSWFRRALEIDPERPETLCALAAVLREEGRVEEAVVQYREIIAGHPDIPEAHLGLAQSLWDDGDAEGAVTSYRQVIRLRPEFPAIQAAMGQVLASSGDMAGAIECFNLALAQNRNCIPALFGLATTLRGKFPEDSARHMLAMIGHENRRDGALSALHNGLAHYYDGIGAYDLAATHAHRGNATQWAYKSKRGWRYDPAEYAHYIDGVIATFTPEFFRRTASFGLDTEMPVFIVGMPRSGTTLVEQILASHPSVLGIGERTFASRGFGLFPALMDEAPPAGSKLFSLISEIEPTTVRKTAQWHFDQLQALMEKSGHAPETLHKVVDKMPDNFSLVGWIHTLFPRARIIHCRRDARDVALSCWITSFSSIPWACDLDHIAERILQYRRVLNHWREVLPSTMLEIDYEALVADQETQTRRLIEWLGLEWNPACLAFYRGDRLVRTASVSQVRQPVYRQSVERWRRYEEALAPLLKKLETAA
jgi:tetratricopeptide (TPR) repeat protein